MRLTGFFSPHDYNKIFDTSLQTQTRNQGKKKGYIKPAGARTESLVKINSSSPNLDSKELIPKINLALAY